MSSSDMITIKTNYQGDNRRFRIVQNSPFRCLQEQVRQVYSLPSDTATIQLRLSATTTFTKLPGTVSVVTDTFVDDLHWNKVQQRAVANAVGDADPVVKLLVELSVPFAPPSCRGMSRANRLLLADIQHSARSNLLAAIRNGRSGSQSNNTAGATSSKPRSEAALPADLRAAIRGRPTLNAPLPADLRAAIRGRPTINAPLPADLRAAIRGRPALNAAGTYRQSDWAEQSKAGKEATFVQALTSGHAKLSHRKPAVRGGGGPLLQDIRTHSFGKPTSSSSERIAAEAGVSYAEVTYVVNPFKKGTAKVAPKQASTSSSPLPSSSARIAAEAGVKYGAITYIVNPFKKGTAKLGRDAAVTAAAAQQYTSAAGAAVPAMPFEARKHIVEMVARELGVVCTVSVSA